MIETLPGRPVWQGLLAALGKRVCESGRNCQTALRITGWNDASLTRICPAQQNDTDSKRLRLPIRTVQTVFPEWLDSVNFDVGTEAMANVIERQLKPVRDGMNRGRADHSRARGFQIVGKPCLDILNDRHVHREEMTQPVRQLTSVVIQSPGELGFLHRRATLKFAPRRLDLQSQPMDQGGSLGIDELTGGIDQCELAIMPKRSALRNFGPIPRDAVT